MAAAMTLGLLTNVAHGAPSDATRQQLDAMVANVKGATARVYDMHDNTGLEMDSLKVIADPNGGYLGVYHTDILNGTEFVSSLATSPDLVNWTCQCQLGTDASMPNLYYCPNGGFVAVWEQTTSTGSKNHIHFAYYQNRSVLLTGTATQSFDAPMTLSLYAEGTPNIYSVTMTSGNINTSSIDTGGHYNDNTLRLDRQQRGTLTNFSSWSTAERHDYDNAILYWGVGGNIGGRDFLTYNGYQFNLMEGQGTANNFGTWKVYDFDFQTGNADQLSVATDGGSASFGNPHGTLLTGPDGNACLVFTVFIFSQGAAAGEAGPALYYVTLPTAPAITNGPTAASGTVGASYAFAYGCIGYPAPVFSVAAGTLPPGLTLSSTGLLDGTPAATGSFSGLIRAVNSSGTATQSFSIKVTQSYGAWATGYFGGTASAGATADPEDDGTENLLKFALGINPTVTMSAADAAALPAGGVDAATTPGTLYLTLKYRLNPFATGITISIQTSPDLKTWSTVTPAILRVSDIDAATGYPIMQAEAVTTGSSRAFMRLNVTMP